jgi:uncharacterized protein (TIGR02284 family)
MQANKSNRLGAPGSLARHLNDLIELDLDAIEAYEAAIARLSDPADKVQLGRFLEDHHRHAVDLSPLVQEAGASPATAPDFRRVLTKGKVVLMGLAGDIGVLEAMKSNEETTTKTYERASRDAGLPLQAKAIVDRNYADEQRHLSWIEQRIDLLRRQREGVRHP